MPCPWQGSSKPLFFSFQRLLGASKTLFSSIQRLLGVSKPLFLSIQRLPTSPNGLQELREMAGKAPGNSRTGPNALQDFSGTSEKPLGPAPAIFQTTPAARREPMSVDSAASQHPQNSGKASKTKPHALLNLRGTIERNQWDHPLPYSRRLRMPAGSQCLQILPLPNTLQSSRKAPKRVSMPSTTYPELVKETNAWDQLLPYSRCSTRQACSHLACLACLR